MKKKILIFLSLFFLLNRNFLSTFVHSEEETIPTTQTEDDTGGQSNDIPIQEPLLNSLLSADLTGNIDGSGNQNSIFSGENSLTGESNLTGTFSLTGDYISTGNTISGNTIISGNLTTLPNLIISEVFFRGTDEWVEITNLSSAFSGSIILSGVKTSNLQLSNIYISTGSSVLFGDTFANIIDRSYISRDNLALSISDSKYMDIKLIYSGLVIDSFIADTGSVDGIKDYSSLEKIPNTNQIQKTSTDRKSNITGSWIANPGLFLPLQTISTGDSQSSGGQNTGFLDSGNLICMDTGVTQTLSISEIFPGNVDYGSYIELSAHQAINQHLILSGSALHSAIDVDIKLDSGGIILLTNDNLRFAGQNTQVLDILNLSMSGGSITIYGQSGQVLDSVYVSSIYPDKSLYFSNFDGCVRQFFSYKNFSPGMDEKIFFRYMTTGENTTQMVYIGGGGGSCSCPVCPNTTKTGDISQSGSVLSNSSIYDQIEIVDIIYDPPGSDTDNEVVILKSSSSYDIDLSKYRLQIEGQSTKKTIRGNILLSNSTMSYTGNYQFPNTPNCILLLKDDQIVDKFCYSESNTTSIQKNTQTESQNKVSGYEIQITQIDYDPIGSDKDNEKIGLKLISNSISSLDLSNFKIQIQKEGKTYNHYIKGTLSTNQEVIISTDSIFPNSTSDGSDVQVYLVQDDIIYSSYSYNPNKSEFQSGSISPYSGLNFQITFVLPNPEGKDNGNEKIGIKVSNISGFQYSDNIDLSDKFYLQIGQSKKKLSGYLHLDTENILTGNRTLPNKASCISLVHDKQILNTFCYETAKEGEFVGQTNQIFSLLSDSEFQILGGMKFSQSNGQICITYKDQKIQCKKLPSTKTARKEKQELKLYRNYMSTIQNYIKNQRSTIYSNSDLKNYFSALNKSKDYISLGKIVDNLGNSIFEIDRYVQANKEKGESILEDQVSGFIGVD